MKINQVKNLIILLLVVVGIIPNQLVLSTIQNYYISSDVDLDPLRGSKTSVSLPRLMTDASRITSISKESEKTSLSNQTQPNFAIGSQSGSGGGSYDVTDIVNITQIESLSLIDGSTTPENHEDSFTIAPPSGFTNTTGWFNISNIAPQHDWRHIENDRNGDFLLPSDTPFYDYKEVAMQFNFTESLLHNTATRPL